MSGFLSGVIWGGAVAAFGLALASQVAPLRVPAPVAPAPAGQQAPVSNAPASNAPVSQAPDPLMTPADPALTEPSLPTPGAPQPPAPEAAPETAEPEAGAPEATAPGAEAPEAALSAPPETLSPETPSPETELSPPPGSEFARPLPDVDPVLPGADSALDTGAAPAVPQPEAAAAPAPDTASAERPAPVAVEPGPAPAADTPDDALAALPGTDATATLPEPAQPEAPGGEAAPAGPGLPPPAPASPSAPANPPALANPPASVAANAAPEPGFNAPVDGVTTGRLPSIGTDAATPAAEATAQTAAETAGLPPLQRFARPFENPGAKPLFAVLLIDTGGPDLDRVALARLPFPVSFAIDPLAPDAETAAAIYREAGQEVLMLATGIPPGATASDLEVTFQAHEARLPEAVAVLDTASAGFQDDRPLAAQVATLIKAQGRGLLTYDRGLNAADQVARREALPAARIFRTLDAEGEASPAIRRYLDRAAFKAAQDGRVTVIGSTRPETVAALLEWSVEGRASSVTLAPASAVMAVQ